MEISPFLLLWDFQSKNTWKWIYEDPTSEVFFRGDHYIGYADTFRYKRDANNNSNTDHWCNLIKEKRKKEKKKKKQNKEQGTLAESNWWPSGWEREALGVCEDLNA